MTELILKNTELLMKKCISFLAFISLLSNISIALDTITPNQLISGNQTLVSPNQMFELGFFSPSNSKNRYLGIWYKFSPLTVVWVANRNNPLTDSSGVLTITYNGDIVLLNRSKSVIWSSNTSRAVESPVAQLLDSGNLVLKDDIFGKSASYLWQSFDYLCDTLIPGMKQGWNLPMGVDRYLTSWKNVDDPSIGEYSYRMEHSELPQLVLCKGSIKQFRTGSWNGIRLSGITHFFPNPVFKNIFMANSDEAFYMTEISDTSIITRLVVNQSGIIQRFTWNHESLDWRLLSTVPKDQCDNYGFCGNNSICNINNATLCQCLHGFRPKLQQNWDVFNWLEGCVRRIPLDCGKGDRFLKIEQVKLPDTLRFWINKSMSLSECEVECLKNCNCAAYTNSDIRGGGSGCIIWFGDLIDIRQFIDEAKQDLYIRLAASEVESINNTNKKKRPAVMIAIISIASSMLLLGLVIGCIIWKIRKKKEVNNKSGKEEQELPLFDWATIVTATDNFSYANKIGEGGFGSVYKGNLVGGQEIAVKRLSKDSSQGLTEFTNELILIAKLQHRNLVKLLGCCIQGEEKMLIYEYMPNKSLDYFIFDKTRSKLVDWKTRFEIVLGIARGLLYLHQDSRLRIIHRDLKACNILLDSNLNPKISNFGMAKLFGGDQTEEKTKRVVGTYGYMSPEYAIEGYFSVKSDIFSFGVLVLEIVSGRRNRGFYHPNHHHNLLGHAWILWEEGKALKLMDSCLEDSCVVSEVLRCIQVGLLCVQKLRDDRPNMSSVVFMLGTESLALPQPKQPGFFGETSPIDTGTKERRTENLLTITSLEAR